MKQDILRVSLLQSTLYWEDPQSNLGMFETMLAPLAGKTDIAILPEMFTTGFSMDAKRLAEPVNGPSAQWMQAIASKYGFCLTGSIITEDAGKYYNRMYWCTPLGTIEHYDKRHLFRMAGEDGAYSAGLHRVIVNYRGWRILLLVCYDLRFPVWIRNRMDYDFIICVANWPAIRSESWKVLSRARAIENLCYVAAVNRIGVGDNDTDYTGDSALIGPRGEDIAVFVPAGNGVLTEKISLADLNGYRLKFPAHMDADDFELNSDVQINPT